jgi:hypothetical protein
VESKGGTFDKYLGWGQAMIAKTEALIEALLGIMT